MPTGQFYPIKLISKEVIARDIVELTFEKPAGFMFLAGQFVQFQVPDGKDRAFRSYSLSSIPTESHLQFCTKILPDGKASQFFSQLQNGDTAYISNAKGVFVCKGDSIPQVFIATGTGLAPVMSMVSAQTGATHPRELLFGVRSEEDMFWTERLEKLKASDPNFKYQVTLSKPSEKWAGLTGRVTDHLVIDTSAVYYICGSLPMVKDARTLLVSKGVPVKQIYFEIF